MKQILITKNRCIWATNDPLYEAYHDHEWGVPIHDDRFLFEFLILEGAQAGLSWITILKRREEYRKAFANFNPQIVAKFDDQKIEELMQNAGIIRNLAKINSAVKNAQLVIEAPKFFLNFDHYLWQFVADTPLQNFRKEFKEIPAQTTESQLLSKDLKKRGFNFVGPTIMYAFMQAVGMVNDHTLDCFRHAECQGLGSVQQ